MRRGDAFDAFYREHRPRILHQTYAYCGDVDTAKRATSDAFVHAAHHWRKLRVDPHSEAWLRGRAFRATGLSRNRGRRPWYVRTLELPHDHRMLLLGLQRLSPTERTLVVLSYLAGADVPSAAREVGVTDEQAHAMLRRSIRTLATTVPVVEDQLSVQLEGLRQDLGDVEADQTRALRRDGQRRRRSQLVLIGLAGLSALVAAGALTAVVPNHRETTISSGGEGPRDVPVVVPAVRVSQLLPLQSLADTDRKHSWKVESTSWDKNAETSYDSCLSFVSSDPHAQHFWIRTFTSADKAQAVQTLQDSMTRSAAKGAYARLIAAYGQCSATGRQLVEYDKVTRSGDEAALVRFNITSGSTVRTQTVVAARTGTAVTTFSVTEPESSSISMPAVAAVAQSAVNQICKPAGGQCGSSTPLISAAIPPESASDKSFLSVIDLPTPHGVTGRWLATAPTKTTSNLAATPCDKTSFASTTEPMTRSYVIDGSTDLPAAFGVTETSGRVSNASAAATFVAHVHDTVRACHKKQLSLAVSKTDQLNAHKDGVEGYVWSVNVQLSEKRSQKYLTAVIRVGDRVAQVTFTPTPTYKLSLGQFEDVVVRAGQRLQP